MKMPFYLPKLSSSRKARSKALTLSVIVGIVTFTLATFGGKLAMGKVSSVVVAATDLQPGQVITDKDLKNDGKLAGILPAGVVTSKSQVIGLSLTYPVKVGQPLVQGLVSKTPMRNGLYPGEVGVWVGVTLTTSGLVKPGDLVDVYLSPSGNQYGKVAPPQAVGTLQGVRVVAVVNGSAQPVKVDAGNPNGNVPAAVELAIPKFQANEFSDIAAGKVSLMLDPFATPLTTINNTGTPAPGANVPNSSIPNTTVPSTDTLTVPPIQSSTTNTTNTPNGSNVQNQTNEQTNPGLSNPGPASDTVSSPLKSGTDNYNPPIYNPTETNSQTNK